MIASVLLAAAALACNAGPVHTARYPGQPSGLAGMAWVATTNGAFAGQLFFSVRGSTRRATIPTTTVPRRAEPKVLWVARHRGESGHVLRITGRRLDASGRFSTRALGVGGGQFPSYVRVPHAGCWRITVSDGRRSGSVVFAAVDRF